LAALDINLAETLAVLLAAQTFKHDIAQSRVLFLIDNTSALAALRGLSKDEALTIAAKAARDTLPDAIVHTNYVRSDLNQADAPSRFASYGAIQPTTVTYRTQGYITNARAAGGHVRQHRAIFRPA
jgi:hypothetical protein